MSSESSAEVQKEAEVERAELVSTLDRLRENLKPANVVDEVMASANISTSEISNRIWLTVRRNPVPAAVIGIGAAMLLGAGQKVRSSRAARRQEYANDGGFREPAADWNDWESPGAGARRIPADASGFRSKIRSQVQAVGTQAAESAGRWADQARSLTTRAADTASDYARSAREGLNDGSGDDNMSQYSRSRDQVTNSISRLLDDQPLVLAAIGVAIGAALGAAIPSTDTEARLMGDASESFRSRAQELAQAEYRHLKETASHTVDELKQAAADRGASTENLSGLVQDAASKVKDAASDVADHAADSAGLKS